MLDCWYLLVLLQFGDSARFVVGWLVLRYFGVRCCGICIVCCGWFAITVRFGRCCVYFVNSVVGCGYYMVYVCALTLMFGCLIACCGIVCLLGLVGYLFGF